MPKCAKCGKEFAGEHGLKVHMGRAHGGKAAQKAPRKAAKGRKGKVVCSTCGRSFKMAMHLARHRAAAHGSPAKTSKAKKKAARRVVHRAGRSAAVAGVNVNAMALSRLLALRNAVDARLADIVAQLRQNKLL
jgi:uncharacterized C2H2 Zn-finger protein